MHCIGDVHRFHSADNNSVNWLEQMMTKALTQLECGPMPNVMVALPNIGGALCSTTRSMADAHYWTAVQ